MKTNLLIEDVDGASDALHGFLTPIKALSPSNGENDDGKGELGRNSACISDLTTPEVSAALLSPVQPPPLGGGDGQDGLALSHIYDCLIKHWIATLSDKIPGRIRVAIEKRLRETATQLYLASFGVRPQNPQNPQNPQKPAAYNEHHDENGEETVLNTEQPLLNPTTKSRMGTRSSSPIVPAAEKPQQSPFKRSASELASSQVSEDMRFMPPPSPTHLSLPAARAERKPSLRSSQNSAPPSQKVVWSEEEEEEDAATKRLRALATSLTSQPPLPLSSANILRHWTEGSNPEDYDWLAVLSALTAEQQDGDEPDEDTKKVEMKQQRRLKREIRATGGLSSSQPLPTRVRETKPSPPGRVRQEETSTTTANNITATSQVVETIVASVPSSSQKTSSGKLPKRKVEGFR